VTELLLQSLVSAALSWSLRREPGCAAAAAATLLAAQQTSWLAACDQSPPAL
jgi:hypothetical protein